MPILAVNQKLKKLKQSGELTIVIIDEILSENKKSPKSNERSYSFRKFFPSNYLTQQINEIITYLLSNWQAKQIM